MTHKALFGIMLPMHNKTTNNTVYDADTAERMGSLTAVIGFVRTLRQHWPQVRLNMAQDWHETYRGTYMKLLWAILMPIVPMSVFMLLAKIRIFQSDGRFPAGVYIAAGITIWMLFAETITITINAVRSLSHSLADAQTPLIVPLVSNYSMLFSDTAIRLLALLVWVLIEKVPFQWYMLAFPLLFIPMIAFSIGLGLILATFNIVLPDIDQLTGMILRYAIFFSHAFFPLPAEAAWVAKFAYFNIPGIFVVNIRELLILGECSQPTLFVVASIFGVILFVLGIRTFFRLEPHIIERL